MKGVIQKRKTVSTYLYDSTSFVKVFTSKTTYATIRVQQPNERGYMKNTDLLTAYGKSGFIRKFEDIFNKAGRLSIRPLKTIKVTGSSYPHDITVTIKEDGLITGCNHAGADYEDLSASYDPSETESVLVCRACNKFEAEGRWYDIR